MRLSGLYLVTQYPRTSEFLRKTEEALNAGVDILQLRDKSGNPDSIRTVGTELNRLCSKYGVPLIINDFPDIYRQIGADGFHMGLTDGDIEAARRNYQDAIIGASAECDMDYALRISGFVDYVAFGPFFPTHSKEDVRMCNQNILTRIPEMGDKPSFAIGGITPENAVALLEHGISGVAVISSVYESPDPAGAVASFRKILSR